MISTEKKKINTQERPNGNLNDVFETSNTVHIYIYKWLFVDRSDTNKYSVYNGMTERKTPRYVCSYDSKKKKKNSVVVVVICLSVIFLLISLEILTYNQIKYLCKLI